MLAWIANLDFAASGSDAPETPAGPIEGLGAYLLLGTGCWIAPLLAAVLMGAS